MADHRMPPRDELCKLLDYNPETGDLTWKARDDVQFAGCKLPHRARAIWNARYAGKRALTCPMPQGHLHGNIGNRRFLAHRVIWVIMTGIEPGEIDHINGNPADNRWCNLRDVTHVENGRNYGRGKHNTSGVTGVSFAKNIGKWHAYIQDIPGSRINLGYFDVFDEAVAARRAAEKRFGYHKNHGQRPSHSMQ